MTTKIEWFNTSDALPKDDKPVIGDNAVQINEWCYFAGDKDGPKWRPSYTYKKVPDPIRWAYIPKWTDEEAPIIPGVYDVLDKEGKHVLNMFIPEPIIQMKPSRYFGNAMMMERRSWFNYAEHTFRKVEELVI
jgi:hypothetical protein